jgi:protocatechuate 3,4-dioxygenase beta subunit
MLAVAPLPGTATAVESQRCDGFSQTPGQIGGIHFRPSPLRRNVVFPKLGGTRLTLAGLVLATTCIPVRHARLDFLAGGCTATLRRHRLSSPQSSVHGADGRYSLETIVPGPYPGRTPHIHVKVNAPGKPTLTTELYFPGASYNNRDPYFDRRCSSG